MVAGGGRWRWAVGGGSGGSGGSVVRQNTEQNPFDVTNAFWSHANDQ